MSTLYNSNQIVIGAVLLFLIGYTFSIRECIKEELIHLAK